MSNLDDFIEECLKEHNAKRALHKAPQLKHSHALDRSAQEWAEELISDETIKNCALSSRGEIGESISMRTSTSFNVDISGLEVVSQWYADHKNYNYESCSGPAGNFTQLVWSNTREVGFGKARASGKCIVVAHYRPPGNIRGQYKENVHPLTSSLAADVKTEDFPNSGTKLSQQMTTVTEGDDKTYVVHREVVESTTVDGRVKRSVNEVYNETPKTGEPEGAPPIVEFPSDRDAQHEDWRRFVVAVLELHNSYRSLHSAPPLTLDNEMCGLAQKWADYLLTQHHLSNSGYKCYSARLGENVFSRWSNSIAQCTSQELLEIWYNESVKYAYNSEPESIQGIGSFTQLVWNSSRLLGVGCAMQHRGSGDHSSSPGAPRDSSRLIIVCFYHPPGNITGEFMLNVKAPVKSPGNAAEGRQAV